MLSQSVFIALLPFGLVSYSQREKIEVFVFMLGGKAVFIYMSVWVARHGLLKKGTNSLLCKLVEGTFVQISRRRPFFQKDVGLSYVTRVQAGFQPRLSLLVKWP